MTIEGISYCTDALDDLVRVGLDIATGKGIAAAIFDHEPALTALVAETAWTDGNDWHQEARLSVIQNLQTPIEPTFEWRESVEADFLFSVSSRDELARLFLDAALRVWEAHGAEGYRQLWGGRMGFPRRAVAALEAALNCPPDLEYNFGDGD